MHRYKILKQLGDGTYGSVTKAVNVQTGEIVVLNFDIYSRTGGHQENEKEIHNLGRMSSTQRSEGN